MSNYALILPRNLLRLSTFLVAFVCPAVVAADARVSESYGKLPLHFEANQGQAHEDVRFLTRGSGYSLYLTPGEAVFVLAKPSPDKKRERHGKRDWRSKHERSKTQAMVLRMAIVGADPAPLVSGLEGLSGKVNYFIGNDPARWRTNVATYRKVHYREVYPGIDLVYYGNQRQLEYDFIVAPGADPRNIVLDFRGADRLEIDAQGDLVLHFAGGALRQKKPVIYQEVDGIRREIAGGYFLQGANRVGFEVATYDASRPLVIDPVLAYSTYLGGGGNDFGYALAVDTAGNAYVTGSTTRYDSSGFPTTPGAFQTSTSAGWSDAFVTKMNAAGSALVYSAILGGGGEDWGFGIAVDTAGHAYVTGQTEGGFPTTPGAIKNKPASIISDAFVTKLHPTGSALIYSTHLGGSDHDGASGIAVDADGNAYVTGGTASSDFPTTPGAFETGTRRGFVSKLNPSGTALVYSTTSLGGSAIAVDADGNAYLTGSVFVFGTASPNFPTTPGAFQTNFGGGTSDAYVAKLDAIGSALVYSTYLGGSGEDRASAIAIDASRNAYVTGYTGSTDFPTTAGVFQSAFAGGTPDPNFSAAPTDAFVTKLDPTGSALAYSTYLGGSGNDFGYGIVVDTPGNAYLTGDTQSTNFPTTPGAPQAAFGGGTQDVYVTKLNPAGSVLAYSTYLGGSDSDESGGIAVDTMGNAYVTGSTRSSNFPTTPGVFRSTNTSSFSFATSDVFVAKIADGPTRSEESAATYTGSWTSYGSESGNFSGGGILASNSIGATATFTFTGTAVTWIGVRCDICGIATVSIDGGVPTVVNTAGPSRPPDSLMSEPVYSASGLVPGVNHTLVITVTGTTTTSVPGLVAGHAHIAVDAFDVTIGGGTAPPLLPPLALPPLPGVPPLLPALAR
jgi:beta-propeller repeat-containing protein